MPYQQVKPSFTNYQPQGLAKRNDFCRKDQKLKQSSILLLKKSKSQKIFEKYTIMYLDLQHIGHIEAEGLLVKDYASGGP